MTRFEASRKGGLAKVKKGLAMLTPEARAEVGRKGGSVKCPKGLAMYSPEQRAENARRAASARWAKYRAAKAANGYQTGVAKY